MITKAFKQTMGLACVLAVLSGCSSTSTQDDAANGSDVTTGSAATDGVNSSADALANLQSVVYFDFDQSMLGSETRAILLAHAEALKTAPRSVRLEGHADERGSREYNMALGERRGNAVSRYLVLQGVAANAIEVVSFGEERPVNASSNSGSWAENRRVELKYLSD
jgi:peptidoglycan-associated lipoprotein